MHFPQFIQTLNGATIITVVSTIYFQLIFPCILRRLCVSFSPRPRIFCWFQMAHRPLNPAKAAHSLLDQPKEVLSSALLFLNDVDCARAAATSQMLAKLAKECRLTVKLSIFDSVAVYTFLCSPSITVQA